MDTAASTWKPHFRYRYRWLTDMGERRTTVRGRRAEGSTLCNGNTGWLYMLLAVCVRPLAPDTLCAY